MANIFTSDPDCVAVWRFENGALTTDTIGTNTLTDNNTVATSTGDYKEGSACADFELSNSEFFSVSDADLDSGFPLKNGDTTKEISVCGWFKAESLSSTNSVIFCKYDYGNAKRSIYFGIKDSGFRFLLGYNSGASYESLYDAGVPSTGRWYHFGFTYKDSDKSWNLIVWDDTDGSKAIDTSGTATNNVNVEDGHLGIGSNFDSGVGGVELFDGLIDEVVVFKDILTTDEIDAIRGGTYDYGSIDASTATLTVTANAATVWADTTANATTATLDIDTISAIVGLNQSITAITASLTLSTSAAIIEVDVVHVNAATATLTITPASATISYDIPISPTSQALTITPYNATVWDGAAWNAWLATNAGKVIRKYTFTLTGEDDGEEDIDIPFSSFQCRRRNGEPTYLSIVVKDLDYSSAIAARSNGDMKITMSYIVNGTTVCEDIISIVDLEDIQLDRGGSNQSISLTGHRTISYTPKSIELRDVTYYRLKDGKYIYRCAAPDLYLAPGDTATFGDTSFVVDQVQYTVSVLSQMMQVKEA